MSHRVQGSSSLSTPLLNDSRTPGRSTVPGSRTPQSLNYLKSQEAHMSLYPTPKVAGLLLHLKTDTTCQPTEAWECQYYFLDFGSE